MFKNLMFFICFSQLSGLALADSITFEFEEINKVCSELKPDEFKRDSGGFPFVVKKNYRD